MAEEDCVKGTKDNTEGSKSKSLWWCFAIILLILGILSGLGIFEYQKFNAEKGRLGDELMNTKKTLSACQVTKVSHCESGPKVVIKKPHKVHRYAAPKPPVVKPKVAEKAFDPRDCGEMDAVINKATGKPECRAVPVPVATFVPAPVPAPVVAKVEAPKPEMKCEKPLIRKLNDDGGIECIALPAEVAQPAPPAAVNGCLPPDQYGRIFCRRTEVRSSSSWVPWAIGGTVLAVIANNRHHDRGNNNPPPTVITQPQPRPNPGPGVVTLPPGPGVVTH